MPHGIDHCFSIFESLSSDYHFLVGWQPVKARRMAAVTTVQHLAYGSHAFATRMVFCALHAPVYKCTV